MTVTYPADNSNEQPRAAAMGKKAYHAPVCVELGKFVDIVQNVSPGSSTDVLGTGFDPDPFAS